MSAATVGRRRFFGRGMAGAAMAAAFAAGCVVNIMTDPDGASVYLDGEYVGVTPVSVPVNKPGVIRFEKKGYDTYTQQILPSTPKLSVTLMGTGEKILEVRHTKGQTLLEERPVFAEEDVIETSPNVAAVRRVTDNVHVDTFCVLADSSIVAQVWEKIENEWFANLWRVPPSGKGLQRLTQGNFRDYQPGSDAEGRFVYFSSNRSGVPHIWRLNVQGAGGLAMITRGTTEDWLPNASADGSELIYVAKMRGSATPQIWITPLRGGHPIQLRQGYDARWSPDGQKILFTATVTRGTAGKETGKSEIWTITRDGAEPTQLTSGDSNAIHPSWSPDGTRILFADDRGISTSTGEEKHNYDIWVMDANGGNPVQLTTNGSRDDHPSWGLDGRTIYFRSNRGKKWDIWSMQMKEGM